MTDRESLIRNVRTVMDIDGISQADFAEKAGISLPYLNRFLQGKVNPSIEVCSKLADATEIPLPQLILPVREFAELMRSAAQ